MPKISMNQIIKTKRSKTIRNVSLVDFFLNSFMGVSKVLIAYFSNSIAIASDSILNFGDALSNLLTYIGSCIS